MGSADPVRRPLKPARPFAELERELRDRDLLDTALTIARDHHALIEEVLSASRVRHVVQARRALAHALRAQRMSQETIGMLLDRDHRTVANLLRPRKYVKRRR